MSLTRVNPEMHIVDYSISFARPLAVNGFYSTDELHNGIDKYERGENNVQTDADYLYIWVYG